ncbi:MAG: argininosuccinate synthase [Chloroflexota bacterium]
MKKCVLAYSGGLDTSVCVPWLKNTYGCEVVCFCADLGQEAELDGLEDKAIASGASKCYVEDLRTEFLTDYVFPTMQAGAIYERDYLLGTSFARPLIAKRLVEIAEMEGADAIAHGATGKGNDQVRFELTVMALNPKLTIIAPWREWTIRGRSDALDYAEEYNVPVKATVERIYSQDRNLFHLSNEGGPLEDPWNEPPADMFEWTVSPEDAPEEPEYLELYFRKGLPERVNGTAMGPVELMQYLNEIGIKHGIGRVDIVENRLVGMKSRGVYETPGGTILYKGHAALEQLCLDSETLHYKQQIGLRYAELVYNGRWFTPLRQALDAFVQETEQNLTGLVRFKLYKGNVILAGRRSPNSLYREDYVTFDEDEVYNQADAEGFIRLYGLPLKVQAMLKVEGKGVSEYDTPDYTDFKRD